MTPTGSDAEEREQQRREDAAARLFSGRVEFLLSAPQLKFLPDPIVPEIAFAGAAMSANRHC